MTFLLGRQLTDKEAVTESSSESRGEPVCVQVPICPILEANLGKKKKKNIVQTLNTAGLRLLLILLLT